jgi:hypothetical protein
MTIPSLQLGVPTLLSFIEFLGDNHLAPPTIRNYISSVKSNFNSVGLCVSSFNSPQISLALLSLSKN